MDPTIRKLIALFSSIAIGFGITITITWFFTIEIASFERLVAFPNDWGIMDLFNNVLAVLILFGTIRGSYSVIMEVCFKE